MNCSIVITSLYFRYINSHRYVSQLKIDSADLEIVLILFSDSEFVFDFLEAKYSYQNKYFKDNNYGFEVKVNALYPKSVSIHPAVSVFTRFYIMLNNNIIVKVK